ncbi:MAG TPA: hypothetical protein VKC57_03850, partial [Ktedonobacterales bacterium]|nr:hypothetical protein [Ktedonobacterales bacterium]
YRRASGPAPIEQVVACWRLAREAPAFDTRYCGLSHILEEIAAFRRSPRNYAAGIQRRRAAVEGHYDAGARRGTLPVAPRADLLLPEPEPEPEGDAPRYVPPPAKIVPRLEDARAALGDLRPALTLWGRAQALLRGDMTPGQFDWLRGAELFVAPGTPGVYALTARTSFAAETFAKRFDDRIRHALQAVSGQPVERVLVCLRDQQPSGGAGEVRAGEARHVHA